MDKLSDKQQIFGICVVLIFITLAAFWPLHNNKFISTFDDDLYITNNNHVKTGLSLENIIWAFTTAHAYNWHPITWLSHILDCQLFGLNPGWHHLVSLLFHTANALLLFYVLKSTTGLLWQSAFAAALFALHPLHVESVAWASERKDILSTFFGLLTIAAYVRYVKRPQIGYYLSALLAFALGLMSKQMLVTLPLILLLLDYWPLNRLKTQDARLKTGVINQIFEKLPFFILSIIAAGVVYVIQKQEGTVKSLAEFSLPYRIENALASYVTYIFRMIWPGRLAVFYPHLIDNLPFWKVVAAALLLVGITIVAVLKVRQYPYFMVGWFWYLITLVPVAGFVQVGVQASADRYTYIPLTGLFIIIAWGIPDIFARLPYKKTVFQLSASILLLALGVITNCQVRYWRNDITLYRHAAEVVRNNWWAHLALGGALLSENKLDEASVNFTQVLQIEPGSPKALSGLGIISFKKGDFDRAVTYFTDALTQNPDFAEAQNNLGYILMNQGKFDDAAAHFEQALRVKPDFAEAHFNLSIILSKQGKSDKAFAHYDEALRIKPDLARAQAKETKSVLTYEGDPDENIKYYTEMLKFKPDNAEAHYNLANALWSEYRLDEAVNHYNEALKIKPYFAEAHNNLGNIFGSQGRFDEAAAHFRQALRLKPYDADMHYNLGVLFFRQGKTGEAVAEFRSTLQIDPNHINARNILKALHKKTQ
jgi:tetratricopeptide (TPR) repeat protein